MAIRSTSLEERLSRLEKRNIVFKSKPLTKAQRDECVRQALENGDAAALLAAESNPDRRAVIEAAMRADS